MTPEIGTRWRFRNPGAVYKGEIVVNRHVDLRPTFPPMVEIRLVDGYATGSVQTYPLDSWDFRFEAVL